MTKQAKITKLLAKGMSARIIADIVGCGTSYVRTIRQRLIGVRHDLAWKKRNPERVKNSSMNNYNRHRERYLANSRLRYALRKRAEADAVGFEITAEKW